MEKPFEAIGKKIRKRRKALGFKTQEALADAVGTDRTRVSRWETGEEAPVEFKAALAKALSVTDDFFKEDQPTPQPTASAMAKVIQEQQNEIERLKAERPQLSSEEVRLLEAFRKAAEIPRLEIIASLTELPEDIERWKTARDAAIDAARAEHLAAQETAKPQADARKPRRS